MKFKILDYDAKVYPVVYRNNKTKKPYHRFKVVFNQDDVILRQGEYIRLSTNMVERGYDMHSNIHEKESNSKKQTVRFKIINKGNNDLKYYVRANLTHDDDHGYYAIEVYAHNLTDHPIKIKKHEELCTFIVNEPCIRRYEYNKCYGISYTDLDIKYNKSVFVMQI